MGKYLTKMEADFILEAVNIAECNFILDVGAEAGRISQLATEQQANVIGIDIDLYGLKRLKLKNRQVDVILADARKIPLHGKVLDAALMIEVLDYISDIETALSECYRILRPGGSLVLSFGNSSSLKSKLRKLRGRGYLHSYEKVLCNLDKTGFRTKRKMGYNWLPFNRVSENSLIPLLARIEGLLGLRKICKFSPWILVYAVKPS